MLILKQLILGLLLPAAVGGGILILAKSITSKRERTPKAGLAPEWLVAVALSAGYIVGYLGLEGLPPFPPREGVHWLCYLAIIGLTSGAFCYSSLLGRLIGQIGLSIVIPRLLLNSAFKYTWGPLEGIIWWACIAVAIFIFWHIVHQNFTILPTDASESVCIFWTLWWHCVNPCAFGQLAVGAACWHSGRNFCCELDYYACWTTF